jgi:hypothetical protein
MAEEQRLLSIEELAEKELPVQGGGTKKVRDLWPKEVEAVARLGPPYEELHRLLSPHKYGGPVEAPELDGQEIMERLGLSEEELKPLFFAVCEAEHVATARELGRDDLAQMFIQENPALSVLAE